MNSKRLRKSIVISAAILVSSTWTTYAQVRSITLGVRTHCPYGVMGCWAEIRDGLERPESVASIAAMPDRSTDTCDVQMRPDWKPDPDLFARTFAEMHIGVDVRGIEVTLDGFVERRGTHLVVRVGQNDAVIHLAPLTGKVQWDPKRKQPQEVDRAERNAYRKLAAVKVKHKRIRLIGPLKNATAGSESRQVLEVRRFEILRENS